MKRVSTCTETEPMFFSLFRYSDHFPTLLLIREREGTYPVRTNARLWVGRDLQPHPRSTWNVEPIQNMDPARVTEISECVHATVCIYIYKQDDREDEEGRNGKKCWFRRTFLFDEQLQGFRGGNYLSSVVVINHQVEKRMFRKIHVEQRTDLGWCPGMTGGTLSGWEVPTVFTREEEGQCSGRRSTCIQTNQSGHSPGVSCR